MAENEKPTKNPWSLYWASGDLHSCTIGFPEAAQALVEARWRSVFAGCPTGTRILDIATGNGAVLARAGQAAHELKRDFSLAGVDRARVMAGELLASAGVKADIHSDVDASNLPYDDDSFDLATSQFGMEYADLSAAVHEALRVAPKLVALVHAEGGIVVAQNTAMVEQARYVREDLQLFQSLNIYFRSQGAAKNKALGTLQTVAQAMRAEMDKYDNPSMLENLMRDAGTLMNYANRLSVAELQSMTADMDVRLRAHMARMTELAQAARSEKELADLAQALNARGRTISLDPVVTEKGEVIGFWLEGERSAG